MSDERRKNARTQGKYSDGNKEFMPRRHDKQSSKMPSPVDNNKDEKRKCPSIGLKMQNGKDLKYEDDSKYSFKEHYEPKKKPKELRFTGLYELSNTENGTSQLIYDPDFMNMAEADENMTILKNSTKWYDKNIVIKGVEYPQPRLVAWYGPHPYTYAGTTLNAREMPPTIYKIKEKVEESLRKYDINVELNSVLLNLYRNEKDSVSWHSDDELSLGVCPTIASISLGDTRKFEMRPKSHIKNEDANDELYVNLTNGSLIIMDGCMQKDWQHRVPKEYHARGERINLTFRTIFPFDQLPPEMPHASNIKFTSSHDTEVVCQQEDMQKICRNMQVNAENFPPLGVVICEKKSKLLPKESNTICFQQTIVQRKSQKQEKWDNEMFQCIEGSNEIPKIQNNLSKELSYDTINNSSKIESSQMDSNLNIKEPIKSCNMKFCPIKNIKSENNSDCSETQESCDLETNEVHFLESKDICSSENKSVKLKTEVEEPARPTNSGKTYTLNADAPVFLPQNKFEAYSLFELAEYCKNCRNVKSEDLQSFSEVFFNSIRSNDHIFIERDFHELNVYYKLNDGTLRDRHLRIILERISSMIKNAYYRRDLYKAYGYQDNYRKPRQSYSRSQKY